METGSWAHELTFDQYNYYNQEEIAAANLTQEVALYSRFLYQKGRFLSMEEKECVQTVAQTAFPIKFLQAVRGIFLRSGH